MPYLVVVERPTLKEIENVFVVKTQDDLKVCLAGLKSAIYLIIDLEEVDYSYCHYNMKGGLLR